MLAHAMLAHAMLAHAMLAHAFIALALSADALSACCYAQTRARRVIAGPFWVSQCDSSYFFLSPPPGSDDEVLALADSLFAAFSEGGFSAAFSPSSLRLPATAVGDFER